MSHVNAYVDAEEDSIQQEPKQAWTGVLPDGQSSGKRVPWWACSLLPRCADLCAAAAYVRVLLLWCTVVFVVGGVLLILPMSLLANEAALYQVTTEAESGSGTLEAISMTKWSSTPVAKDSLSFWLFWLWCLVCRRSFTYGCFFILTLGWWDSSLRALLLCWLPGATVALLSLAWELSFKVLASRGVLSYTRALSIADVTARYVVWFAVIVYCFARSAPGQQRTPPCAVVKLVLGALTCYLCVTQVIQAYGALEARNPTVFLLMTSTVLKLQRAVLTHMVIRVCEGLPHSTGMLTMTAGMVLHATSNTGIHFVHFQSEDYGSLILVQLCGAFAETSTNLGYLLCQTELERWKQLARWVCCSVWRGPAAASRAHPASSGGAQQERGPQLESRQRYFACMVMLANVSELITLGFTTMVFLLCQQGWAHLLAISGIALAFELAGDVCTVALGHRWYTLRGDVVPAALLGKEKLWAGGHVKVSVLIACVGAALLGIFLTAMCPLPDQLGGLREINRCVAR